jgi:hypothetical protein
MIQVVICGNLNVIEGSCALINSILVNSENEIRINIVTEYVNEYKEGINQWCDSTEVVRIINPNDIDLEDLSNNIYFRDVSGLGEPEVDVNSLHPDMGPEHQYKYLIPKANILHWTGKFKPWTMKRGSGRRYCDVWWDYLYYYKERR